MKKQQSSFKYFIACRETGDKIEGFASYEEAKNGLSSYEEADKIDGIYVEDFYEITREKKYIDSSNIEKVKKFLYDLLPDVDVSKHFYLDEFDFRDPFNSIWMMMRKSNGFATELYYEKDSFDYSEEDYKLIQDCILGAKKNGITLTEFQAEMAISLDIISQREEALEAAESKIIDFFNNL